MLCGNYSDEYSVAGSDVAVAGKNILLTLRFLGTNYHGFQVQSNAVTVAQLVQDAIEQVVGVREDIKGCSRTDAGVHARSFCLNFKTESNIPPRGIQMSMNRLLPEDISVVAAQYVPEEFHARYSCTGKEYRYQILNARVRDPFLKETSLLYHPPIDVERMQAAAVHFIGSHDFKGFSNQGAKPMPDTVRTISVCRVEREENLISVVVQADGFLYNMVRIIVGTLLRVSEGKIQPEEIPAIICAGQRHRAGPTAPAIGLILNRVFYPEGMLLNQ